MDVGIIGLPASGKTTLFSALTGAHPAGHGDKTHVGVAQVPDPRLGAIAGHITTRKIVPATVRLVDIPGVPGGSDARKLNAVLEQIRQVDAICLVVRCFDDGTGAVKPAGDIATMETELILADLAVAESAYDKAVRSSRSGDKDAIDRRDLLEKVVAELEAETPIRARTDRAEGDVERLRSYGFVTAKPVLYVANIAEDAIGADSPYVASVRAHAESHGGEAVALCAKLEAELAELDDADRQEMLGSLGLAEPAIGPLARAAHRLLGLTTFYTAGDQEVRAWTIRFGSPAPIAAGAIHSDIQRGFIRAECYHVDDLLALKSEKAIREAGKLRSEGKNYEMRDGDVVHFLFNV